MCGANFAILINVSSSPSWALGIVTLKGVREAVVVEGGVLKGNDIAN